jgi:thiol peroxidase
MVVDAGNIVRHLQITPELGQLPDLDDAFQVARKLVTTSGETLSKK